MYNVSQLFKDLCDSYNREFEFMVGVKIPFAPLPLEIPNERIFELEIERNLVASDSYSIGNCISAKMTLEVLDEVQIPLKSEIFPMIRVKSGSEVSEWIKLGVFYVFEKDRVKNKCIYKCYDVLAKSDTKYLEKLGTSSVLQILSEIKTKLSIGNIITDNLTNYTILYKISKTYRDSLRNLATMNAGNFTIDNEGNLKLIRISPSDSVIKTITGSDYINLNYRNEEAHYSKLVFNFLGEKEYIKGNGDDINTLYAYGDKYFGGIYLNNIIDDIYNRINGIAYMPIELEIKPFPYLELGDKIKIIDYDTNQEIETYIMGINMRYTGGLSMKIISKYRAEENVGDYEPIQNKINTAVEKNNRFIYAKNETPITITSSDTDLIIIDAVECLSELSMFDFTATVFADLSGERCDVIFKILVDDEVVYEIDKAFFDRDTIVLKCLLKDIAKGEHIFKLVGQVVDGSEITIEPGKCELYIRFGVQVFPVIKVVVEECHHEGGQGDYEMIGSVIELLDSATIVNKN